MMSLYRSDCPSTDLLLSVIAQGLGIYKPKPSALRLDKNVMLPIDKVTKPPDPREGIMAAFKKAGFDPLGVMKDGDP